MPTLTSGIWTFAVLDQFLTLGLAWVWNEPFRGSLASHTYVKLLRSPERYNDYPPNTLLVISLPRPYSTILDSSSTCDITNAFTYPRPRNSKNPSSAKLLVVDITEVS